MTILNSAYETSIERGRQLGTIRDAIEFCIRSGSLDTFSAQDRIVYVRGKGTHIDAIPPFQHPLQVNPKDPDLLAVDLRTYVSLVNDYTGSNYRIKRPTPYQVQMARTLFNQKWIKDGPLSLLHVSSAPMAGYSIWVKDALGNKITMTEGVTVRILAAYYYYCQHFDETEFAPRQMNDVAMLIQRATRMSISTVTEVLGQLAKDSGMFAAIVSLEDFCRTVMEVTDSPRLRGLSPAAIIPVLANTWDGSESKALVATAIEFPPSWLAYYLSGLITRMGAKSRLWNAVQNSVPKGETAFVAQALITSIRFDTRSQQGWQQPEREQIAEYI